jgi:hypothetical protein
MQRYLLFASMAFASTASAQARTANSAGIGPAVVVTDSGTWSDGQRAGRDAAARESVGDRGALAFLGGLPVGFFGLLALSDHDAIQTFSTGGGLALISYAFARRPPQPAMRQHGEARGETYSRAFAEAYSSRMRSRQQFAAVAGGAVGGATGLGALFFLLTHLE